MPRLPTYETPTVQAEFAKLVQATPEAQTRRPAARKRRSLETTAVANAQSAGPAPAAPDAAALPTKDDYLSKIAKYVPAETITFVTLVFAAWTPTGNTVWVLVALGSVVNVIYLLSLALAADPTRVRPPWFFYLLSAGAFWLWAMATIDAVQKKAGIEGDSGATKQTAILAAAAFLIPALDTIFAALRGRATK